MMGLWMTSMLGMRKLREAPMAGMLDLGNWTGTEVTKDLKTGEDQWRKRSLEAG